MNSRPYSKRKRVVTACWECQRRKQKCDRQRPCNHCIARNADEKCTYGPVADVKAEDGSTSSVPDSGQNPDRELEMLSSGIIDQIGYPSMSDDNPFISLQKSLQRGNGFTSVVTVISSQPRTCTEKLKDKFVKLIAQLPSRKIITELSELYFKELNHFFRILESYYFYKEFSAWLAFRESFANKNGEPVPRDIIYFTALLFQLLAVQLQFLQQGSSTFTGKTLNLNSTSDCEALSHKYSAVGQDLISLVGRQNSTIAAIQFDIMRSYWFKTFCMGTKAWYAVGDAIKQAQDQELHLQANTNQYVGNDSEQALEILWYDEYKRRLWVGLFIHDSFMSMVLGRPRTINAKDCTIKRPLDCDFPTVTPQTSPKQTRHPPFCTPYTNHLFFYDLSLKVHDMLSSRHEANRTSNIHAEVIELWNTLPPAMHPEVPDTRWDLQFPELPMRRLTVSCTTYSFLLSLHRPYAATVPEDREEAIKAALGVLRGQQEVFERLPSHQYRLYGLSFHSINAAIFLASTAIEFLANEVEQVQDICFEMRRAIVRLEAMASLNPMAKSGAQILAQCYQKLCQSIQQTIAVEALRDEEQPPVMGEADVFQPNRTFDHSFIQYPPPPSFLSVLPNIQAYPDIMPTEVDFNASIWDSMNFIGDSGVDQYGDDFNWDFA